MVVINADSDLCGYGDAGRLAHGNHTLNEFSKDVSFPGQGRTTTAASDFGHRAAEVQIHMVGHVFIDHDFRGLFGDGGIHTVELQRTNLLATGKMAQTQSLGVARHEGACGNHFGHVETVGTIFLTDHAEWPVGHTRHRRQHHRSRHGDVAELNRGNVYLRFRA